MPNSSKASSSSSKLSLKPRPSAVPAFLEAAVDGVGQVVGAAKTKTLLLIIKLKALPQTGGP
jgi:hypothetical protein